MSKFRLDFRKISWFISKNTVSKVILKYQVLILTCPSIHPAYPKIHFRITLTVNLVSRLYINGKFQKCKSVFAIVTASFMRSLFTAFKNDELCHFVVRIGSLALISFYCVCIVSFYFSLFLLFCGVHFLLRYGGKFNNTYNKVVKLFLGSYVELRVVGCLSLY